MWLEEAGRVELSLPMSGWYEIKETNEVAAVGAFENELPAVRVADSLIKCRRWAEDVYVGWGSRSQCLGELFGVADSGGFGFVDAG